MLIKLNRTFRIDRIAVNLSIDRTNINTNNGQIAFMNDLSRLMIKLL